MEDQSKNPFINQDTGKQTVGPFDYGHNPPIHKLKSGNKYPNNILDKTGSQELKNYYKEPEVIKFFKDNNNKIKSRSEGPGGLSNFKYFSNPNVGKLATVPFRAVLGIKSKPDPTEKFAS